MFEAITLPNFISLSRIPLALVFLNDNPFFRITALLLAMVSDGLDGFLARYRGATSRIGAILDPLTDRFFIFFVLCMFLKEGRLQGFEMLSLLSRDGAIMLFGFYLLFRGQLKGYSYGALCTGKATTLFQFLLLLFLINGRAIPAFIFPFFLLLSVFVLCELFLRQRTKKLMLEK